MQLATLVIPACTDCRHSLRLVAPCLHTSQCPGDGRYFYSEATRAIKKGEAITWNYSPTVIHRSDMCILQYGYVPVSACRNSIFVL